VSDLFTGSIAKYGQLDAKFRSRSNFFLLLPAHDTMNAWKGQATKSVFVLTVPVDMQLRITGQRARGMNCPPAWNDTANIFQV
jgi:hypothetical protein